MEKTMMRFIDIFVDEIFGIFPFSTKKSLCDSWFNILRLKLVFSSFNRAKEESNLWINENPIWMV